MKKFKKSALLFVVGVSSLLLTSCNFETLLDGYMPKEISTAEEFFKAFEGQSIQKTKFLITQDLDFASYDERFPISNCDFHFNEGVIDGQGHKFKNINITASSDNVGMFTEPGVGFQNLIVEDAKITVTGQHEKVGIFGGVLRGDCYNVHVSGTIDAPQCDYVGGLAGAMNLYKAEGCFVDVKVNGSKHVGGMFGSMQFSNQEATFNECINNGEVTGVQTVGGLVGKGICCDYVNSVFYSVSCKKNENHGIVNGADEVGGIIGQLNTEHTDRDGYTTVVFEECVNKGKVTGTNEYAGGILGKGNFTTNLQNCMSEASAEVNGKEYVGGIAGEATIVNACRNKGKVNGEDQVGGVVGYLDIPHKKELSSNYNEGSVTSAYIAGGIAGTCRGTLIKGINSVTSTLSSSQNNGQITGGIAGGIVGNQTSQKVDNAVIGLLGYDVNRLILKNNSNYGNVRAQYYGAGIVAYALYINNIDDLVNDNINQGQIDRHVVSGSEVTHLGDIYAHATTDGSEPDVD